MKTGVYYNLNIEEQIDLYYLPGIIKQLKICTKTTTSLNQKKNLLNRIKELQKRHKQIKKQAAGIITLCPLGIL